MARSARNRHLTATAEAGPGRSCDRSRRAYLRFVSAVRCSARNAMPASNRARSLSSLREGKAQRLPSTAPRRAPAFSGDTSVWQLASCQIAEAYWQRHRPSDCFLRHRRIVDPTPHRCRRRVISRMRSPSPAEALLTGTPASNQKWCQADHSHPAQALFSALGWNALAIHGPDQPRHGKGTTFASWTAVTQASGTARDSAPKLVFPSRRCSTMAGPHKMARPPMKSFEKMIWESHFTLVSSKNLPK